LVCAGASGLAVVAAPSANAAAPSQACSILYSARITFWAMTCSQPGEPMIGGFATWRNVPITFDQVDTGSATVKVANYVRVTPNTENGPLAANIEIGLYADKTGKTTYTYGPRWSELTTSGGRTHAITAGVNPGKADGRNHTYMAVRQASGNQWDVLYDFNKVGATTSQLKVPRGNPNRIDIGLEVTGPKYVNVPAIADRMQFMTENKNFQPVATANTAKSVTLPACSTSHPAPNCFTTKLTDARSFTQWTVSKPRRQTTTPAPSAAPAGPPSPQATPAVPDTFNGVDQKALQACLAEDPDSCLTTVPGLVDCVTTIGVCNATALDPTTAPDDTPATETDITASDIRSRAAAAFDVPADQLTLHPPISGAAREPSLLTARDPAADTWTVTSTTSTPGLAGTQEQRFDGFTVRYSARTGTLLEACWGQMCAA
jgi:hypothetical protein